MTKPKDIDAYLARVPPTHRPTLVKLRAIFKKLYPKATEQISYSMPLYKLDGRPLGGFAAFKKHNALFVWSGAALGTLGKLLDGYDTGKGTVRFAPDKPLPGRIVKAVLAARAKEIKVKGKKQACI